METKNIKFFKEYKPPQRVASRELNRNQNAGPANKPKKCGK